MYLVDFHLNNNICSIVYVSYFQWSIIVQFVTLHVLINVITTDTSTPLSIKTKSKSLAKDQLLQIT
jgi:hypothetical protein